MRRPLPVLPFAVLAAVLAALLAACGQSPTTEQLIIAEIREMEAELEAGERLNFIAHVAEDFRGQGGAMGREELRAFVILQFNRYKNLQARLLPITVQVIGESEARADFQALLTGGPNWIPDSGQLYQIRTHWGHVDGEWLLTAASWEPVTIGELLD